MSGSGRKTACVTGGNGYIASALIKMLLNKGYTVKTTVRDPGTVLGLSLNLVLCCMYYYFSDIPFTEVTR
jgi:dTDP-D-glucose 4,6-dehydratase